MLYKSLVRLEEDLMSAYPRVISLKNVILSVVRVTKKAPKISVD